MFVICEAGSVQRSVWRSDDFDPLRSSSREFRDNGAESFEIFDSVDAHLASLIYWNRLMFLLRI